MPGMKKSKLEIDYDFDFYLAGIVSPCKSYTVAWAINKCLDISLAKTDDEEIDFNNFDKLIISNFTHQTEHSVIRLLKNRSLSTQSVKHTYMLPEAPQFDYLLYMQDDTEQMVWQDAINSIRQLQQVTLITDIKIDQLKSKENLLF